MPKTEIAKQLERERKKEMTKEARQRRRELTTPSMRDLLRREAQLAERKARLEHAQKALQNTKAKLRIKD